MAHRIDYMTLPELELHVHPDNPKDHAIDELIASFERFDFAAPILACDRTGYIAAGHGRLQALTEAKADGHEPFIGIEVDEAGEWLAPVVRGWSSRDDDELLAYVIADNRQNELGGWKSPLATILDKLRNTQRGLRGIGYVEPDVARMLAALAPPTLPDRPEDTGYREQYGVIVVCDDERDQRRIFDRLSGEGLKCRVVVT